MSKGGSQTVTQQLDPQTQAYVNQMRRAALGYAGIGGGGGSAPRLSGNPFAGTLTGNPSPFAPNLPPEVLAAQQQYQQYANAGNLGLTALTGGANPFYDAAKAQALDPIFARARQQALGAVGDDATLAGAFGGSRHGVAEGEALAGIANQQTGLEYQGYLDSLQRAMGAANLGFGAGARAAFLPQQFYGGQLGLLQQGLGPYGMSQTTQTQNDPFSQLLGLGLTAGGFLLGGPPGAAAGSQIMGSFPGYQGYG